MIELRGCDLAGVACSCLPSRQLFRSGDDGSRGREKEGGCRKEGIRSRCKLEQGERGLGKSIMLLHSS